MRSEKQKKSRGKKNNEDFPAYPYYPGQEDIYKQGNKEEDLNPDDRSKITEPNTGNNEWNEKSYDQELTGDDLDVPGTGPDDLQKEPGIEDEENDYYSLGGDEHSDLDEDKGDLRDLG